MEQKNKNVFNILLFIVVFAVAFLIARELFKSSPDQEIVKQKMKDI